MLQRLHLFNGVLDDPYLYGVPPPKHYSGMPDVVGGSHDLKR